MGNLGVYNRVAIISLFLAFVIIVILAFVLKITDVFPNALIDLPSMLFFVALIIGCILFIILLDYLTLPGRKKRTEENKNRSTEVCDNLMASS